MEKQTAVEWLVEEMFKQGYLNDKPLTIKNIERFVNQAKEMEKQQIIDAFEVTKFGIFAMTDKGILDTANKSGKQYYNETFKSE
jgi:hypothetical protein